VFLFCELFIGGYSNGDVSGFEPFSATDSKEMDRIKALARRFRCGICFGFAELANDPDEKVSTYNYHLLEKYKGGGSEKK